jgi:hypothetical protein
VVHHPPVPAHAGWHIARQPFGLVAGKIQYQQTSVAVFEGYAGTSESGFRAEVEKERAEAQLDDLVERYEDDLRGVNAGFRTIAHSAMLIYVGG